MRLIHKQTEQTDQGPIEILFYQDGGEVIIDTVFSDGTILRRSETGARWIFPDDQVKQQKQRRPWWRFW